MAEQGGKVQYVMEVRKEGLGILLAAIFLAGQMAGVGVLALPSALVGTNWMGLILITLFSVNAVYIGSRLGLCWCILEERYEEYREKVRDPYPTIGEMAIGKVGRHLSSICIACTLYGGGCVIIVLIASFLEQIFSTNVSFELSRCYYMMIVVGILIPITWLGTPNDFWQLAVGALLSTIAACLICMIAILIENGECTLVTTRPPATAEGFFKAFGSIMFAFSGASTFPTIQADMKDRTKFPIAAAMAIGVLFVLYFPMAAVGYFVLGVGVSDNIIESMCEGPAKIVAQVLVLLHLMSALPILINAPNQYFEELLGVPKHFTIWRCVYRGCALLFLLLIAESLPNFGAILDLVGGSTVTLLTFVFPPFFYMRLVDSSQQNKAWPQRTVLMKERIYCWALIILGIIGGGLATYNAVKNIATAEFHSPCFLDTDFSDSE